MHSGTKIVTTVGPPELSSTEPTKPLVPLLFQYVNKAPRSAEEFYGRTAVLVQLGHIRVYLASSGRSAVAPVLSFPTNRSRHFADTAKFREATRTAAETGSSLLIGDVWGLLQRTPKHLFDDCIRALELSPVPIVDAKYGAVVNLSILARDIAKLISSSRSAAIRSGIVSRPAKKPSPDRNRLAANASRAKRIQHRDAKLETVVNELRAAVAPDKRLSPTRLAHELNARGHLSAQGKPWTLNSAKNLIKRLQLRNTAN